MDTAFGVVVGVVAIAPVVIGLTAALLASGDLFMVEWVEIALAFLLITCFCAAMRGVLWEVG